MHFNMGLYIQRSLGLDNSRMSVYIPLLTLKLLLHRLMLSIEIFLLPPEYLFSINCYSFIQLHWTRDESGRKLSRTLNLVDIKCIYIYIY